MVSSRREFIGTVIGTLVASGTDFVAKWPETRVRELDPIERTIACTKLFGMEEFVLRRYKMFAVATGGLKFLAPGIKRVDKTNSDNTMSLHFVSEDLKVSKQMDILGYGVMNSANQILMCGAFSSNVTMIPGDRLKATYTLSAPILQLSSILNSSPNPTE